MSDTRWDYILEGNKGIVQGVIKAAQRNPEILKDPLLYTKMVGLAGIWRRLVDLAGLGTIEEVKKNERSQDRANPKHGSPGA